MTRKESFVADARRYSRAIWDGLNALEALQHEATALDYVNTLGTQDGLESADVIAVVFATADALRTLLNAGHATNMAKVL
jgi:hypothetical protein